MSVDQPKKKKVAFYVWLDSIRKLNVKVETERIYSITFFNKVYENFLDSEIAFYKSMIKEKKIDFIKNKGREIYG